MVCLRFAVAVAVSFACMAAVASGLSCYQCSYTEGVPETATNQKNCANPFNETGISKITNVGGQNCVACTSAKIQQVTVRSCSPVPLPAEAGGVLACTTDNCNGSSPTAITLPPGISLPSGVTIPGGSAPTGVPVAATTQQNGSAKSHAAVGVVVVVGSLFLSLKI
ncbi:hypothetical protein BV898_16596 [Hypsibius exemplaris]|uniref:UPAR/Ly6 domain-containing protein n=1 Tax=Hypsibius exemplaris TaxID=2072580 RepID=A0A9X6NE17_HYPEX|nr:hypothetical protein BV898_16596 [Hypsibius exemplaris]